MLKMFSDFLLHSWDFLKRFRALHIQDSANTPPLLPLIRSTHTHSQPKDDKYRWLAQWATAYHHTPWTLCPQYNTRTYRGIPDGFFSTDSRYRRLPARPMSIEPVGWLDQRQPLILQRYLDVGRLRECEQQRDLRAFHPTCFFCKH